MSDTAELKRLEEKVDRMLRILERLEDRVSAVETGILHSLGGKASKK